MESVPDEAAEERINQCWDSEWQNNLVQVAIERIKPRVAARTLQIFQLHVRKDLPVAEVARRLGVSKAQVHLAKFRVSTMLRKELTKLKKRIN